MRSQHKKRHRLKENRITEESFIGATPESRANSSEMAAVDQIKYSEQDFAQVRHVFRDAVIVVIALIIVGAFFGSVLFYDGRSDFFEKLSDSASRAAGLIK
jgi:hypothetical protein